MADEESAKKAEKPAAEAVQPKEEPKKAPEITYPPQMWEVVPAEPVFDGPEGIKFDFNYGIRIQTPKEVPGGTLTFEDADTGLILYSGRLQPDVCVTSRRKFYVRYKVSIHWDDEEKKDWEHTMELGDKEVLVHMPVGTLGDSIGWFSYVERFQQANKCRVLCCMLEHMSAIFRKQYPDIEFLTKEEAKKRKPYASYFMGLFFHGDTTMQPIDFKYIGLHRTAAHILGLKDDSDIPPRVTLTAPRKIKEKYVCIGTQSSSQCKYWNNPYGWYDVVRFLKEEGYRVICVDKMPVYGAKGVYNKIPWGCEDETGDKSLQERIDMIKDADFFVGLSSGLSWLAWCCKVPVVLISGFTEPNNEFYTPYRIWNPQACHGCWNDMKTDFVHNDFLWCPRKSDPDQKFECTKLITQKQVIDTIKRVPTFRPKSAK